MSIIITENGKAVIINMFCNAFKPPAINRMMAKVERMIPQITLVLVRGVSLPPSVIIPITNVALSAKVTKNDTISKIDMIDKIRGSHHI
jgi:hypothetical protein